MQSEFIKLTDNDGDKFYICHAKILALVATHDKTAIVFGEGMLNRYVVKETPEQIFKLIDAAKNIVKH